MAKSAKSSPRSRQSARRRGVDAKLSPLSIEPAPSDAQREAADNIMRLIDISSRVMTLRYGARSWQTFSFQDKALIRSALTLYGRHLMHEYITGTPRGRPPYPDTEDITEKALKKMEEGIIQKLAILDAQGTYDPKQYETVARALRRRKRTK